MYLGIDVHSSLVYEGASLWGYAVWPVPLLSPATFKPVSESAFTPPRFENLYTQTLLFREDAFDPVSRVRRGRFYKKGDTQPQTWHVYPHPAIPDEAKKVNSAGVLSKSLFTFYPHSLANEFRKVGDQQLIVTLGSEQAFTIWTIVAVERTAVSTELVTLKARQSFGVLPQLNRDVIPVPGREKVLTALDKLVEDNYRASPDSVVDCAREAVTAALSVYLQDRKLVEPGLDLGDLLEKLRIASEEHKRRIAVSAGEIVQRLHSRRKNAEQEKRQFRSIREQDAELAVQCVGTILCELGWAKWI